MLQTGWNTLVLLCFNNKRRRRRSCRRTVADFFFRCDGVGEILSVLVLFPDVHRLAVPRACSLNESHRVARCLINLRRWTPVSVLRWICGPHDGESCCNMKPGSRRSHISLLQRRLRRPQPVVIWVYSALCAQSSCSPRQFLAALERHRVCRAAITLRRCPAVCVCVWIIVIIQVIQVADRSGTLRKTHTAGIWTNPPDRASTWNSAACYYGNRKSGW